MLAAIRELKQSALFAVISFNEPAICTQHLALDCQIQSASTETGFFTRTQLVKKIAECLTDTILPVSIFT